MISSPLHPWQVCREPSTLADRSVAYRRLTAHAVACVLVASFPIFGLSAQGQSQSPAKAAPAKEARGLEGAWSGGGSVQFASGATEQARCRAHYSKASKDSYRLRATCATASGKADQTATVHKVGENRYRGNFHNPDYDISGTIFVVVNGNSQNVRLTSSSGSAVFRLSR
jgi:hypothetical protein